MKKHHPVAGGFFLVAPIIVGFVWGIIARRPVDGAFIGLGVGVVLALALWLVDRSRAGR